MAAIPSRAAADRCRLSLPLVAYAAVLLLTADGLAVAPELVSREVVVMGTPAVLSTWSDTRPSGVAHLERLLRAVEDTEAQLSTWRPDSEVSRLNASAGRGPAALSPSLCDVLGSLNRWIDDTGRAFDPAVGALSSAWDLHGRGRVPSRAGLEAALQRSGWHRLMFDGAACTLAMPAGMSLDVGAFGKGDALDRARAAAHRDSPWLIDLGGQVAVHGAPPGTEGWEVSVAHPQRRDRPALRLRLSAGSLATSAGSERDVRVGTMRIGHILDPRTGRPATFNGSVSVWHEAALAADVLSTALFVMGPEKGMQWADARGVAVVYLRPGPRGAFVSRASRAFTDKFSGALDKAD